MKKIRLENFTKGWFVGDFEPSLYKIKEAEVCVKYYKQGEKDQKHVHKISTEITTVLDGKFVMNEMELVEGDIIVLPPNEPAEFECLKDGKITVIKIPSVAGDKYLV